MNHPSEFMNVPILRPAMCNEWRKYLRLHFLYINLRRHRNFVGNCFKKRKCVFIDVFFLLNCFSEETSLFVSHYLCVWWVLLSSGSPQMGAVYYMMCVCAHARESHGVVHSDVYFSSFWCHISVLYCRGGGGGGNISSIRSFNGSQFFHINYNRPATLYHFFSSNG